MTMADSLSHRVVKRDYSLTGESTRQALASGLASADWYRTPVLREAMKELMKRSDGPAIRDTVIWLGLMAVGLAGGIWFWPTWWCVPFFFVYGTLYGSAERLALARVRASHGVQDPMDERYRLRAC